MSSNLISTATEQVLDLPHFATLPIARPNDNHERRLAFVLLVTLLTLVAACFEARQFASESWSVLNVSLLALFTVLFAHVSIGFCQAFFGFLILGERRAATSSKRETPRTSPLPVTAIIVPIYHEDAERVFARIRVMHDALRRARALDAFQFYVLSDSTDSEKATVEELEWARLVETVGSDRVFYRRRAKPINRKSGNVADFCRRWGSQYRYMICLDADSLMSAATLVELVHRMERNHRIGILQTVPQAVNAQTVWGRLQQFAMSAYGPIFSAGANFWQQEDGNYWGHNAIIRTAPFIEHCALPELPGRGALGGRPMSHDFVEAALMRRAGWEVRLADDLGGSYEETPPTMIEHLKRDRRWCQGNLQHWSLLFARGLTRVTRFHLLHGIFSFFASPLLLLLLVLGFVKNLAPAAIGSFSAAKGEAALILFAFTMMLLLLPKGFAIWLAIREGRAADFGGTPRLVFSAFLEMIFSALVAPIFMIFHAKFVVYTLLGRQVSWTAQRRDAGDASPWREAASVLGWTTAGGVMAAAIVYAFTPGYFWWLLPMVVGLWLAIPLVALASDASLGLATRRLGLFLIPQEITVPAEVARLHAMSQRPAAFFSSAGSVATHAVVHPVAHRRLESVRSLQAKRSASDETAAELHRRIWATPAAELAADWREALARVQMQVAARGA